MMKLTVKEVAIAKGIKNAVQLGEKANIPLASIYRIWNGTARMIGLDTLNRLCNVLDVPVGMLITHIPDKEFARQSEPTQSASEKPGRAATAAKKSRRQTRKTASRPIAGACK
jgi:DNA-binding Xre family transcriptional regulator